MTDKKIPAFDTLERALGEFMKDGRVSAVRCETCSGLIEISSVGSSAMVVRCTCGAYNDTLRGL